MLCCAEALWLEDGCASSKEGGQKQESRQYLFLSAVLPFQLTDLFLYCLEVYCLRIHLVQMPLEGIPWISANEDSHPDNYRFLEVQGADIIEVPVGPYTLALSNQVTSVLSVVGDSVLHLELRYFYTHKGTDKLFQERPVMTGAMLAESVWGDNCFSHAVAYCQSG